MKGSSEASDIRRYRRFALEMPARVVVNGIDEYAGQLINISPGDLALKVDARVNVGDAAVVYLPGLDVIEGTIARMFPDGFALSYRLSRRRRALLTERLIQRINPRFSAGVGDRRSSPRHAVGDQRMVCRLADGGSLFVRVIETSVDGVSVEAQRKPPVGTSIHIGRLKAIVMRHTARGFVAVYDHEQRPPTAGARLRAV